MEKQGIVPVKSMAITSIGPYQIERRVAEGGLSTVYAALDPRTGRRVAIKVSAATTESPDHARAVERFQRESSVLAKLKHPNIVSISEMDILPDGSPYVVSDWVQGRNVDDILSADGRIPLPVALSIAEQVAGALGAAHALGFIHSDVKPPNILIQDRSPSDPLLVKLLDFGVAGKLDNSNKTMAGSLLGTFYYMAPEQIRAEALSPSSDVWALGATLFEMLTGSRPFAQEQVYALMSAIMNDKVEIPEDAHLPPPVAAFLMRCLDKDWKRRPANGNEAAEEIHKLITGLGVGPTTATFAPAAAMPAPSSAIPAPSARVDPNAAAAPISKAAGYDSFLWFVAASSLLVLAGVLYFFFRRTTASSEPLHLSSGPWLGVAVGIAMALAGVMLGRAIQKLLAARHRAITTEVQGVLNGARTHKHLSQTLAIQVDELVSKCRLVDERILAMTMAVMVEEFSAAKAFDDRQKALMNAVVLLEKLMPKLSPWYVRHDKLVGFAVTLVGLLSGLTAVVQNLAKLIKG